jgi:hypothetical protein
MKTIAIVVCGDTWFGLEDASICIITELEHDNLGDGKIRTRDLHPIHEFTLKDVAQ